MSAAPRSEVVGIRLAPDELAAMQRAAEAEGRTLSGLIRKVLRDWLQQREAIQ